jgi:hypothetical protein
MSKRKQEEKADEEKKRYCCEFEGCTKSFKDRRDFTEHTYTHTGEKPFSCDFPGCNHRTAKHSNLISHKRRHTGEKPFKCKYCNHTFSGSGNLKTHERTHTKIKPFICDFPECKYASTQSGALTIHQRTHTGLKPFICQFPKCTYACTNCGDLARHICIHNGKKDFECDFKDCGAVFVQSGQLRKHKMIHDGTFTHFCGECGWNFRSLSDMNDHIERRHSGKIVTFEKKEEKVIFELFTEHKISFDREVLIDFCDLSKDKKRAFVDFIIQTANGILIFEVDERMHNANSLKTLDSKDPLLRCEEDEYNGYKISCEQRRMLEVIASLRMNEQYTNVPIAFFRYNPHSFKIDGVKQDLNQSTRNTCILKFIEDWNNAENTIQNFSIHYCCYDSYSLPDGGKKRCFVWDHVDFSDQLQDCVYCVA